ncbi:MAG TPA: hypothetical protein VMH87_01450 [Pseudomonadales bacterium]|nr:hypothetical protein [Pseudomonadales bacterium]
MSVGILPNHNGNRVSLVSTLRPVIPLDGTKTGEQPGVKFQFRFKHPVVKCPLPRKMWQTFFDMGGAGFKALKPKLQSPEKLQASNFDVWLLDVLWSLDVGIWMFPAELP